MADYPYLDGPGNLSQGAYAPVFVTPDSDIGGGKLGNFYSGPSEGTKRCDSDKFNEEWAKWNGPQQGGGGPEIEKLKKKVASLEARMNVLEHGQSQPSRSRGRGGKKPAQTTWAQLNNL